VRVTGYMDGGKRPGRKDQVICQDWVEDVGVKKRNLDPNLFCEQGKLIQCGVRKEMGWGKKKLEGELGRHTTKENPELTIEHREKLPST